MQYATIEEALAALPDDSFAIAELMAERGYRGKISGQRCPIARYLRAETPCPDAYVGTHGALVSLANQFGIPLPDAVELFIEMFDKYHFPELMEED